MEEEKPIAPQIPTEKIYNDKEIGVGTFLGGPLAAGYFIAQNYKEFGESRKAKLAWVISIIVAIIVFGSAIVIEKLPSQFLPIIYLTATYLLVRIYQGKKIDSHLEKDGQIHSWWRVIGESLLILAITFAVVIAVIMGVVFATTPNEISKSYPNTKIVITYTENNIVESEVDSIANALEKLVDHDGEYNSYYYLEKIDNSYLISINYEKTEIIDDELVKNITELKNDLNKFFPNNKIVIKLVVNDLTNVIKKIE